MTTPELLRNSIRIAGSAGEDINGTGTKPLLPSTGALCALTGTDPVCSASTTQRRNRLAFKPRVSATPAIETPGC
jgi:hypothetical protein